MVENLKQKTLSGVIWSAIQKYSVMIVMFISSIILARLLSPFDYGCIGMLSIFINLSETFIDGGFGTALIQKKQPTKADYSTIFFWNLIMALILYTLLYLSAPAISEFYKIPLLCPVLRVQGLILFIYAFNIVQRNQLRKRMNFKALSVVSIVTSVLTLTVTFFMAYKGFGVWSLVVQELLGAAIPALIFWFYVKWRPVLVFSRKSFRELFSFGVYMFMSQLINKFGARLTYLLIGKVYSPDILGYYTKAGGTVELASSSISSVMEQVSYPLYSQVQDDKRQLKTILQKLTVSIAYFTFPLMFVLMLTAKPLIVLLYSDKWLPIVPYFQALCLIGLSECLQSVNTQTIAAIGKSKIMFQWTLVKRTLGSSFIIGGLLLFGMTGLIIGVIIYNWFCYAVNIGLVSTYIGYSWKKQLGDLMPVAITSLVILVLCYFAGQFFTLNMYIDGILKLSIFVILYFAWSVVFRPKAFTVTMSLLPGRIIRMFGKRNK